MLATKSHESSKCNVDSSPEKVKCKSESGQYSDINPLWHKFATHTPSPTGMPLLQPKLSVGSPDDKYEQEADQVAEQVMRMSEPTKEEAPGIQRKIKPMTMQRVCAGCEEELQRDAIQKEEPKTLQMKGETGTSHMALQVSDSTANQIQSLRGGGKPLSSETRSFFEPRFGQDFNQVRVHTDSQAAKVAHSIQAKAFTTEQDVVFGAGSYAPETPNGKKLLAHELTHVVQHTGGGANGIRRKPSKSALPFRYPPDHHLAASQKIRDNAFTNCIHKGEKQQICINKVTQWFRMDKEVPPKQYQPPARNEALKKKASETKSEDVKDKENKQPNKPHQVLNWEDLSDIQLSQVHILNLANQGILVLCAKDPKYQKELIAEGYEKLNKSRGPQISSVGSSKKSQDVTPMCYEDGHCDPVDDVSVNAKGSGGPKPGVYTNHLGRVIDGVKRVKRRTGTTPKTGKDRTEAAWRDFHLRGLKQHHEIPQALIRDSKFVAQLKNLGIVNPQDFIDKFIADLPGTMHADIHAAGYNEKWKAWLEEKKYVFTKKQLLKQRLAMRKEFGIAAYQTGGKMYKRAATALEIINVIQILKSDMTDEEKIGHLLLTGVSLYVPAVGMVALFIDTVTAPTTPEPGKQGNTEGMGAVSPYGDDP